MSTVPKEIQELIEFFFMPPHVAPHLAQQGFLTSSLYLNRREAQDCWLGKVIDEQFAVVDAESNRLFATVMVIVSGIDLLSKFYAGKDGIKGSGKRFKRFAERYMFGSCPSPQRLAEVLYLGCRNPMLHSFTLYIDYDRDQPPTIYKRFSISLSADGSVEPIEVVGGDPSAPVYGVCVS